MTTTKTINDPTERCRHTSCIHCNADIEGWLTGYGTKFKIGKEWRDRGSEQFCTVGGRRRRHAPCLTVEDREAPPKPKPLTVYVLTGESNGSENGESDGWVIGVYGTREGANEAHAAAVQEAIAAGHRVIGYESPNEEDEDEWDRSFAITSYEVKA